MSKQILKILDTALRWALVLCLCLAGVYAGYALWDNQQIYSAAENVQADMLKLKPVVDEEGGVSFEEILAVNGDVCAWVSIDNTRIDYPVVQGSSNLVYLNQDVYGDFALAGSIFLDSRNSFDFSDAYSLLYGHHMEGGRMFGDLDLFKDEAFFNENTTGTLLLPSGVYNLKIFACMVVSASEEHIFTVTRWTDDVSGLLRFVQTDSLYLHEDTLSALLSESDPQILALSTCASDFTDARTILLAAMEPASIGG